MWSLPLGMYNDKPYFVGVRHKVIVPLQRKVTVPPSASAASKCVSSQILTTPPASAGDAGTTSGSKARSYENSGPHMYSLKQLGDLAVIDGKPDQSPSLYLCLAGWSSSY